MSTTSILLLLLGGLVVAAIAVIIDRLNFPQRAFKPRQVEVGEGHATTRDRTGAHIRQLEQTPTANGHTAPERTVDGTE